MIKYKYSLKKIDVPNFKIDNFNHRLTSNDLIAQVIWLGLRQFSLSEIQKFTIEYQKENSKKGLDKSTIVKILNHYRTWISKNLSNEFSSKKEITEVTKIKSMIERRKILGKTFLSGINYRVLYIYRTPYDICFSMRKGIPLEHYRSTAKRIRNLKSEERSRKINPKAQRTNDNMEFQDHFSVLAINFDTKDKLFSDKNCEWLIQLDDELRLFLKNRNKELFSDSISAVSEWVYLKQFANTQAAFQNYLQFYDKKPITQ